MADAPSDENQPQPFRLMNLPPEVRELILRHVFQDLRDSINTIPFLRPTIPSFNPNFDRSYIVALRQRVFALLHAGHQLRLETFDTFMPLALGLWRTVMDEHYELLDERDQRGNSVVFADSVAGERNFQNALRVDGALAIFLALMQAEANSR